MRSFRTVVYVALGICLAALFTPGSASACRLTPFGCDEFQAFVVRHDPCTLYGVAPDFSHSVICSPTELGGAEVNGIGFRSTDGFLYGLELTKNPGGYHQVLRVGRNCNVESLGPVSGLTPTRRYDAGDISPDGKWMYIYHYMEPYLYVVDLEAPTLVANPLPITGLNGIVHDWTYDPQRHMLFGGDNYNGKVARLNPVTAMGSYGVPDLPIEVDPYGAYGGAWWSGGKAYLYRNNGELFEYDPALDTVTPVGDSGIYDPHNDAASCEVVPECDHIYSLQEEDCIVYRCEGSINPTNCVQICDPMAQEMNNSGFRKQDWLIYGVELTADGNAGIIRIDPENNCAVEHAASNAGLPDRFRYDAGDISADGNFLYVYEWRDPTLYVVDLNTWPDLVVSEVPIYGHAGIVHDWAFNPADGRFYGGDNRDGEVAVLELRPDSVTPSHAIRTDYEVPNLPKGSDPDGAFGGAWIGVDGDLHLSLNRGELWRIDLATMTVVWPVWPSIFDADRNDCACCVL